MIDDWEDHFKRIYRTEPVKYNRLVAAEDAYGELAQHVDTLASKAATIPPRPSNRHKSTGFRSRW